MPQAVTATEILYAGWASAANEPRNDLWVVSGDGGILRYSGATWSLWPDGGTLMNPLIAALWGSHAGDYWAVGEQGSLLHFDGQRWTRSPQSGVLTSRLNGIWGSSPTSLWAVGDGGTLMR